MGKGGTGVAHRRRWLCIVAEGGIVMMANRGQQGRWGLIGPLCAVVFFCSGCALAPDAIDTNRWRSLQAAPVLLLPATSRAIAAATASCLAAGTPSLLQLLVSLPAMDVPGDREPARRATQCAGTMSGRPLAASRGRQTWPPLQARTPRRLSSCSRDAFRLDLSFATPFMISSRTVFWRTTGHRAQCCSVENSSDPPVWLFAMDVTEWYKQASANHYATVQMCE